MGPKEGGIDVSTCVNLVVNGLSSVTLPWSQLKFTNAKNCTMTRGGIYLPHWQGCPRVDPQMIRNLGHLQTQYVGVWRKIQQKYNKFSLA